MRRFFEITGILTCVFILIIGIGSAVSYIKLRHFFSLVHESEVKPESWNRFTFQFKIDSECLSVNPNTRVCWNPSQIRAQFVLGGKYGFRLTEVGPLNVSIQSLNYREPDSTTVSAPPEDNPKTLSEEIESILEEIRHFLAPNWVYHPTTLEVQALSVQLKDLDLSGQIKLDHDVLKLNLKSSQWGAIESTSKLNIQSDGIQSDSKLQYTPIKNIPGVKKTERLDFKLGTDSDFTHAWLKLQSRDLGISLIGDWSKNERTQATLRIDDIYPLIHRLRNTRYSVLAPFHILKGPMFFEISRNYSEKKKLPIQLEAETEFKSPNQVVRVRLEGNLDDHHLDLKVLLNDLQISLPPIDPVLGIPKIGSDDRIEKNSSNPIASSEPKNAYTYAIQILSPERPIRLLHPNLKPHLPIRAEIVIKSDTPISGHFRSESFTVEYLKRKADIEFIQYSLKNENEPGSLTGKLKIKRTDAEISIEVLNDSGKPKTLMSSDPVLSSADLVSVLLFDRRSETLESREANSVNAAQMGMAQQAIGLFSIWALASTPIDSVFVDPTTGAVSVQVRLLAGVAAQVGTTADRDTEVGLRRRLGRRWSVMTGWERSREGETIQSAMIEWFRRF